MQSKSESSNKLSSAQWIKLIPMIILLGLSPVFIKYFPVHYPAMPVDWRMNDDTIFDLFTYSKHYLVLLSGFMALLILFFGLNKDLLTRKNNLVLNYALLSTAIIFLLSTIFAKFGYAALWGAAEKYEGLFVWLTYLIVAVFIGWLSQMERLTIATLRIILFSGLAVTLIGLTQFLSHDIIRTDWFKSLIMPPEVAKAATFAFEADRVYSTLYNPNFVAMYTATLIPVSLFMCIKEKSWLYRGLWSVFSILLVINLIGSKNEGGLVGLAFAGAFGVFLVLLKKITIPKKTFVFSASFIAAMLIIILAISGTFNTLINLPKYSPKYTLTDVQTEGFNAYFEYKGKILTMTADSETLNRVEFFTDNVKLNVIQNEDGSYGIVNPDFSTLKFYTGLAENKLAFIHLIIDNSSWNLLLHPDGLKYINGYGVPTNFENSQGMGGFIGYEQVGSARGYIWSRTLPLIFKSPLLGYGADNFTVAFPQKDFNMKYQVLDTPNIIVDKAHNFYLQLAMNFGIPGLMLILLLIGISLNGLLRQFMNTKDQSAYMALAVMLSIFAYLGSGVFYDSSLHVSPFFWTLVGFGYKDYFKL